MLRRHRKDLGALALVDQVCYQLWHHGIFIDLDAQRNWRSTFDLLHARKVRQVIIV